MSRIGTDEPRLVIDWLARLRWLAVIGQLTATLFAEFALGMDLPIAAIIVVISITALTNLTTLLTRLSIKHATQFVPGIVLLDVALLTAVLYLTGGANNPFCVLYIVHVAIATVLLTPVWTWIVVAVSAVCFSGLFFLNEPLTADGSPLSATTHDAGQWVAQVLTAALIAYFIGRLQRVIRSREDELLAARERVTRSERLASVTALAAGAAHELGSPLGTIAVVAKELELNAVKQGASPDIAEDAQLIREEVDRCRAILNRMRLEVGDDLRFKAGVITAREFIDGACADLTDDRKPRVVSEVVPGVERVYLPSRAILRAVGVLLRNGFEASQRDQTITLRIEKSPGETRAVVIDHGSGMAPEVLKRAGEPFFTTKEMGRGMGMGLFIVKLIAEQNGGRLELESEPGKGTTAKLIWPDEGRYFA